MAAKSFKSKIVEAAYNDFNRQGELAVIEHCVARGLQYASFADDYGNSAQMRKPDLSINGLPSEVMVSYGWDNDGLPKHWPHLQIFKRKMHQQAYNGGAWWMLNRSLTYALVLPFNAQAIGEKVYFDKRRNSREPVVLFDLMDAELVELAKVSYKHN